MGWSSKYVHPRKLTCPLKRDYFNRKYIEPNHWFSGHNVSFPGSKLNAQGFAFSNQEHPSCSHACAASTALRPSNCCRSSKLSARPDWKFATVETCDVGIYLTGVIIWHQHKPCTKKSGSSSIWLLRENSSLWPIFIGYVGILCATALLETDNLCPWK